MQIMGPCSVSAELKGSAQSNDDESGSWLEGRRSKSCPRVERTRWRFAKERSWNHITIVSRLEGAGLSQLLPGIANNSSDRRPLSCVATNTYQLTGYLDALAEKNNSPLNVGERLETMLHDWLRYHQDNGRFSDDDELTKFEKRSTPSWAYWPITLPASR